MRTSEKIIWLESVDSTNNEAKRRVQDLPDFAVIASKFQTAGRGQGNHTWLSDAGKNLTFSIFIKHHPDLKARAQFELSNLTAISVVEFLATHEIDAHIKLPNDIYVGENKICGILIENTLRGNLLYSSVVGIGLNVNQTEFDSSLLNPVSMAICKKNKAFDIDECLESLMDIFKSKYYAFISEMTA